MCVCVCVCVDVSIAVIDLLQELTEVDTLNESEEGANALIDALVSRHKLTAISIGISILNL